jgi:hypothetical protein
VEAITAYGIILYYIICTVWTDGRAPQGAQVGAGDALGGPRVEGRVLRMGAHYTT